MLNFGMLLKLLPILALAFGSTDSSNEETSRVDCPQVDSSLDLTGVGFGNVPDGFVKNKFLTELILDNNQIPVVSSKTFSFVPKLIHLSLADNLLKTLDLQPFSKLYGLKTLILNENCKPRLGEPYNYGDLSYDSIYDHQIQHSCDLKIDTVLPSLEVLGVENNNIQQLSAIGSGSLPKLTHLHLSHNPIQMNEETTLALKKYATSLTHLFLKDCNILKLDASKLPTVTALYLDENHISNICNEYCLGSGLNLNSATQLTTLTISHNEITRIEVDSFKDTTNLATLDLSYNQIITIIEGTFDKLQVLAHLNLDNNKLKRLSAVHTSINFPSLEILSLGGNNISHISDVDFKDMLSLKTLSLNDNNLSNIESGTFANLTNLQELSLAKNQLSRIPNGSMPISSSLIILNLDNNEFTSTEHIYLDSIPNLVSLSLKNNPLTTIGANWLGNAPENLTISLENTCP